MGSFKKALVVVFSSLLGIFFGYVNVESVVSKILKVKPENYTEAH